MNTLRNKLREQLIDSEGLKLKVYKCSNGFNTIGVGRNLDTNGISEVEAMILLNSDTENCFEDLNKNIHLFFNLPENVQLAMLDMRFNLGHGGFFGFNKMIKALVKRDFKKVAIEMKDSEWYRKDVRNRAERLIAMVNNIIGE